MDYKAIMESKEVPSFNSLYENTMINLSEASFREELSEKMKKKRAFGLKKYKDFSFQSSFENLLTAPVKEHAMEELIDLANYILTYQYVSQIRGEYLFEQDTIREAILKVESLYALLDNLKGD